MTVAEVQDPNAPTLKDRLNAGELLLGGWCSIANAFSAEVLARVGFDWLCIDMQHGLIDYDGMLSILQAITVTQTPALVRVPWNEPGPIMKALDAGAEGIIVPMINTPADAEAAVGACRYGPVGFRSWGPTRAAMIRSGYQAEAANERTLCVIMIETPAAVARADEILAVPGIDAVFVGPMDLAVAAGIKPSFKAEDPRHRESIEAILRACQRHGIAAGIYGGSARMVLEWRDAGFRLLATNSDAAMMRLAASSMLREIRETATAIPDAGAGYG
jgi:4-hydroxy-2-oxoheptanedioate aldolase